MIEHAILKWSDVTATESQENITNVDFANELKEEDGNLFDVTPADLKSGDKAPRERCQVSDEVNETTSRRLDTDKCTIRQPEKEEQAAFQSSPCETAKNASVLSPVESHLTQEPLENKKDSTSFQNGRSNQKCQSGKFKEMCHARLIH